MVVFGFAFLHKVHAQSNKVSGLVKDAHTNEPIGFASVFIKGTTTGVSTNDEGKFSFELPTKADSICVNVLGYVGQCKPIAKNKPAQTFQFALNQSLFNLNEVVISAGEDPAVILIREIKKKREVFNIDKLNYLSFNEYSNTELFFTNVNPEKFKAKKYLRQFDFMLVPSTTDDKSKRNLPFLSIERSKKFIINKQDNQPKAEQLLGEKVTGFYDETLNIMLDQLYLPINVFEDRTMLFNRPFISPISSDCFAFYNYYLLDSSMALNGKQYHVKVKPKRLEDNAFQGIIYIDSASNAINLLNLQISTQANLNFIKTYAFMQTFEAFGNQFIPIKEEITVGFIPITIEEVFNLPFKSKDNDKFTVAAKRLTFCSDIDFGINGRLQFNLDSLELANLETAKEHREQAFWANKRPGDAINEQVDHMHRLDSLPKLSAYRKAINTLTVLSTGFIDLGMIDLGSLYRITSYNPIEGTRLRIGLRTNNKFHRNHRIDFYSAYGLGDEQFKFGVFYNFIHPKKPGEMAGIAYIDDVELRVGTTEADGMDSDNIFNNILRKQSVPWYLHRIREFNVYYTKYLYRNITLRTQLNNRFAAPNFTFNYDLEGVPRANYQRTELLFDLRLAPGEVNKRRSFTRSKAKALVRRSQLPVFNFVFANGLRNVLGGGFRYGRIQATISQTKNITPKQQLIYEVTAGKIKGTLPYLLLDVPTGNDTYYWRKGGFNNMIPFEFAADKFFRWQTEYHFNGMFFDRLPGIKKLKLREMLFYRGILGSMSTKNRLYNEENIFEVPTRAYQEYGFGIGNIFNVLRLDFTWRAHQSLNPLAGNQRFGIYGIIQIKF